MLLVPNAANTAEVVRRLAGRPRRRHGQRPARGARRPRRAGPASKRCSSAGAARRARLHVLREARRARRRRGHRVPHRLHRRARLRAAGRRRAAPALWDASGGGADLGILPCGLGARDTLRTEMGYPLHGQDISLDITPNQARIGWAVGWKKPAFWGREALLAEKEAGPARLLCGLRATGRGIPRPGMPVLGADGGRSARSPAARSPRRLRTGIAPGAARHRGRGRGGRGADRRRPRPAAGVRRRAAAVRRPPTGALSAFYLRVGSLSPFCGSGESGQLVGRRRAPLAHRPMLHGGVARVCRSDSALISAPSRTM